MTATAPTKPAPLLLTARDAAAMLCVSTRTLWSLTASGALPSVRIGRAVRYAVADLENYIASQRDQPSRRTAG